MTLMQTKKTCASAQVGVINKIFDVHPSIPLGLKMYQAAAMGCYQSFATDARKM